MNKLEEVELNEFALKSLVPSPVAQMTGEFAATFRDELDINLGVGYVNEATMPTEKIIEALNYVVLHPDKYRMPLNYGGPEGSPNLVQAVKRFLVRNSTTLAAERLDELQLIIGANGATSILDSLGDIFEPGIVVTADPYYYIYCETLERKGFDVRTVEEGVRGLEPEVLLDYLQNMTSAELEMLRFLYIITVNNPSGAVLGYEDRCRIVKVAEKLSLKRGRKIPLIFDCAYDSLNHGADCPYIDSVLHQDYTIPVFEIGTFSKILAPALRIGYLLGRNYSVVDALVQKMADIGFSNSLIMQEMTAWMLDNVVEEQIALVNANYCRKAQMIRKAIDIELAPYLEAVSGGQCGFYYYFTFKEVETGKGSKFHAFLSRCTGIIENDLQNMEGDLKPIVVYIPGEICQNPHGSSTELGKRQLRISYGFEEDKKILDAIKYMRDACEFAMS